MFGRKENNRKMERQFIDSGSYKHHRMHSCGTERDGIGQDDV